MADLSRVVVITGAAGNLGRAVAAAFAAEAARLVLVDRDEGALQRAYPGSDGEQLLAPADLLVRPSVQAMAARAVERFGRIDALCNLAGGFRMGEAVHETSDETWSRMMDLNVRTLLNAVAAVVPHMLARGSGAIVNVGAGAALRGGAHMGAYAASKSAVIRLTESQSAELRGSGINVNCVLPSIIDTPENRQAMPDADPSKWVAPDDLASVIRFLASPGVRAVHGAALPVSGLS